MIWTKRRERDAARTIVAVDSDRRALWHCGGGGGHLAAGPVLVCGSGPIHG